MRIDRIDLYHAHVPLPAPFHPSWIPGYEQHVNRFTLIRLRTGSGLEGWSAGAAMGREHAGLGALLGPYLLGERADDLTAIRQRLREMGYLGWRLGWLEAACWDIIGKARQKPVWQLLGGSPGSIRLYASTGEVRPAAERANDIRCRLEEGFDTVKLRVHAATLEEDIELLRDIRERVGDEVTLGVDANQGWRVAVIGDAPRWDLARATAFCQAAGELGLAWVEEPLPHDDVEGMARLRDASPVPIAGAELVSGGRPWFDRLIGAGCLDVYQPDACFTGGIAETHQLMQRVLAAGLRFTPHTWTNGIGFAIGLQLMGASPQRGQEQLEYPLDPPGWIPAARDGLLEQPWLHERGMLALPTAPGLGFSIDRRALRRHATRFFTATRMRMALHAVLEHGPRVAMALGRVREDRLRRRHEALDAAIAAGADPVRTTLAAGCDTLPTAPTDKPAG